MAKLLNMRLALLAGSACLVLSGPANAQQLERAVQIAKQSTAASAAAQQQVSAADDQADSMVRDFRAIRQQIDNRKLYIDKQGVILESQKAEIDELNEQLGTVESIKLGMVPMMLRMTVAIEDSINNDMPFRLEERRARVERVKNVLANPNVSPAEQYRQVLNAFKNEVTYGQGLDSYEGPHPTKDNMKVNYLRYGRVALVFMTKDESEIAFYDLGSKSWKPLEGNRRLEVRQAIRIAKNESAPDLVMAPLVAAK